MAWATTNGLTTPAWIVWAKNEARARENVSSTAWEVTVKNASKGVYILWQSEHYTFHVQYRYRRRWSPAKCKTNGYDIATDMWDDWSEWTKINWTDDGSTTTPCYKENCDPKSYEPLEGKTGGTMCSTQDTFSFNTGDTYPYDEYDKWEYEVWVRAADRESKKCSAWACQTLTVSYAPVVEIPTTITRTANGELYLTLVAHWQRAGNRVNYRGMVSLGNTVSVEGGEVTFKIDPQNWKYPFTAGTLIFDTLSYSTSDRTRANFLNVEVSVIDEITPSTELAAPTLEPTYYEDFSLIDFRVANSENYNTIISQLSFTTSAGTQITSEPTFISEDDTFHAFYYYPIFDVPMTLTITGVSDTKSRTSKFLITIHSYGMVWSNGELSDIARAHYNIGLDEDLDYDTDSIKTALGTRPIMRYGTGGERTIKASCATVRQSTIASRQDVDIDKGTIHFNAYNLPTTKVTIYNYQTEETTQGEVKNGVPAGLSAETTQTNVNRVVERLKQPHDWVFRAPHGIWYNVAVTAVNRSWSNSTQLDTVDVTMQEVEDDS